MNPAIEVGVSGCGFRVVGFGLRISDFLFSVLGFGFGVSAPLPGRFYGQGRRLRVLRTKSMDSGIHLEEQMDWLRHTP